MGLEEVQKTQVDGICYKRLTKTLHWRKDGTQKENKEFLEREVSLVDFWSDFKSFFPHLLTHHDLSKSQGREFASLKSFNPDTCEPALQKGEVRGVIGRWDGWEILLGLIPFFFATFGRTKRRKHYFCLLFSQYWTWAEKSQWSRHLFDKSIPGQFYSKPPRKVSATELELRTNKLLKHCEKLPTCFQTLTFW